MSLGIIVCGVGGRMGGAVVRALRQSGDCRLAAAVDRPGSARVGKDAGEIAAVGRLGIAVTDDLDGALGPNSV
ncbi:MAG TPA: 4-hydroxy-tetrahydrodipicolinate reductase, partial [Candidatus Binatia bacterium]